MIIIDKYKVSKNVIGNGAFSQVFLGKNIITGEKVAIKQINLTGNKFSSEKIL